MEESEKRRERLKAMRMEAAQGCVNDVKNFTVSHGLSNPLIETSTTNQESSAPQRFDYYTDPMSAFSGNKRSKVKQNISQEHFTPPRPQNTVMTSPPALPSQINYSTELGKHQPQEPSWSPIGMPLPFDMQPGTPRGAWNGSGRGPGYYFPSNSPRGGNFPNPASPGFVQGGSPIFNSGQSRGHWFSNGPGPPGPNSVYGGIPVFGQEGGSSFNSDQGRGYSSNNSPSPGSGYGGSPGSVYGGSPGFGQEGRPSYISGQGRGYWSNNSPGPGSGHGGSPSFGQGGRSSLNSGKGRGNWFRNSSNPDSGFGNSPGPNSGRGGGRWLGNSTSPGSGWSGGRGRGGRGRGSHDNVSAELRPDLYYNKSMVEDPWKSLKPVIWKIEDSSSDSLKSWLPKSVGMKSAKAAEASSASKSRPSLAEYLAASFNEAVNNEDINDESSV